MLPLNNFLQHQECCSNSSFRVIRSQLCLLLSLTLIVSISTFSIILPSRAEPPASQISQKIFWITARIYNDFLSTQGIDDEGNYYNPLMGGDPDGPHIFQSGSAGEYQYRVPVREQNQPLPYLRFQDARALAGWLALGQPQEKIDPATLYNTGEQSCFEVIAVGDCHSPTGNSSNLFFQLATSEQAASEPLLSTSQEALRSEPTPTSSQSIVAPIAIGSALAAIAFFVAADEAFGYNITSESFMSCQEDGAWQRDLMNSRNRSTTLLQESPLGPFSEEYGSLYNSSTALSQEGRTTLNSSMVTLTSLNTTATETSLLASDFPQEPFRQEPPGEQLFQPKWQQINYATAAQQLQQQNHQWQSELVEPLVNLSNELEELEKEIKSFSTASSAEIIRQLPSWQGCLHLKRAQLQRLQTLQKRYRPLAQQWIQDYQQLLRGKGLDYPDILQSNLDHIRAEIQKLGPIQINFILGIDEDDLKRAQLKKREQELMLWREQQQLLSRYRNQVASIDQAATDSLRELQQRAKESFNLARDTSRENQFFLGHYRYLERSSFADYGAWPRHLRRGLIANMMIQQNEFERISQAHFRLQYADRSFLHLSHLIRQDLYQRMNALWQLRQLILEEELTTALFTPELTERQEHFKNLIRCSLRKENLPPQLEDHLNAILYQAEEAKRESQFTPLVF